MNKHEIKINMPGILKMLGSNIYSEPYVAVREMIQNAHDTCIIRQTIDKNFPPPQINISFDKIARVLTISDNGTGMTENELHEYLSTIGHSFTKLQREELQGAAADKALLLIGQFGIGLLSAFSIASTVEIVTRSFQKGSAGRKWICKGDIHYSIEKINKQNIGTDVILHIANDKLTLLEDKQLRTAIKKYTDFISVPVFIHGEQVNSCVPPWEGEHDKNIFNDYIQQRYDLYPIGMIPFSLEKPLYLSGLLFIPMIPYELTKNFGEVDIYISRMYIKGNDKELLPRWAQFIKGIINTPDLTPTISRNEIVYDNNFETIRGMLGQIIMDYLAFLEKEAPNTLDTIVGIYNNTIKAFAIENDNFFDRVCNLVRMSTDMGTISIKKYLNKTDNKIYYFSEGGTGTQHKLLFSHKGLPVIDASWGMEEEFLKKYAERKGVKLERLSAGSDAIFTFIETVDEKWQDLERQFKRLTGKEAKAVEFEPDTVPAVLISKPIDRTDKEFNEIDLLNQKIGINGDQIKQMFQKMSNRKVERLTKNDMVLNLNIKNQLMRQLRETNRNEIFNLAVSAIFNNAVMFAQHYITPKNAEAIFNINNNAISVMIANSQALVDLQALNANMEFELNKLKRRVNSVSLSPYRCCFFAYPFNLEFHQLRDVLHTMLQQKYGIMLDTTSLEIGNVDIVKDIENRIASTYFGIADITGSNPNVLWELGLMAGYGKHVIILKNNSDQTPTPFDLHGKYRVNYQVAIDNATGRTEYALLEAGIEKNLKLVFEQIPELKQTPEWRE